jgi:hypothetical protein
MDIIKLDLEEISVEICRLDLSRLGKGPVLRTCEHGN